MHRDDILSTCYEPGRTLLVPIKSINESCLSSRATSSNLISDDKSPPQAIDCCITTNRVTTTETSYATNKLVITVGDRQTDRQAGRRYGSLAGDNGHLESNTKLIGQRVAEISSLEISKMADS